jgi:hypothetical protein
MLFRLASIFIITGYLTFTDATICYDCPSTGNFNECSLVESEMVGHLGCLIEFEDPEDTGLRVRRINTFCPKNFSECPNLLDEKHTWLTFMWKMHNSSTKQIRKNPISNMWYECFHDKCNSPDFIKSLMMVNVSWSTQILNMKSTKETLSTQCYTCSNETVPFICQQLGRCENGCKMQGYRISTNPVASRLLDKFNVRYCQPQCNHDLGEYQSSDYSINGYMINNLNQRSRNIAIEAYCLHDKCNPLNVISELMDNASLDFESEPWFYTNRGTQQAVQHVSLNFATLFATVTTIFMRN